MTPAVPFKIAIYNRLLHYEEAAKCAEAHLEKVKDGYNKKKISPRPITTWVLATTIGEDLIKVFDHFKNFLRAPRSAISRWRSSSSRSSAQSRDCPL